MKPTCEYYTPISQLTSSTFTLFSSQRTCDKNKDSTTVSLSLAGNTTPSLDYVWPRKYIDKCLWVGIVIKYGKTKNWLNTRHFFMSMINVYDNTRSPGVPTQKRHQIWKNCLYYACTEFVALPSKSLNSVSVTQSVKSKQNYIRKQLFDIRSQFNISKNERSGYRLESWHAHPQEEGNLVITKHGINFSGGGWA